MIQKTKIPVKAACKAAGVNRSCYYEYLKCPEKSPGDLPILEKIEGIVLEFPAYGYRRVTKELHRRGNQVNHKRVLRVMRENNILCKKKRFRVITTDSNHNLPVYSNLTKDLQVTRLNQLWVSDITYILLPGGHVYLAAILEIFSRKCIGWDLGRHIDTVLVMNALEMAITTRKHFGFDELIHHSDQGVQYASHEYVNRLRQSGIKISMSRKGNPYDNAFAESFIKTLKAEEVYIKEYKTFDEAYGNIKEFIEIVYNKKRLHSSIGYVPPDEFEAKTLNNSCS